MSNEFYRLAVVQEPKTGESMVMVEQHELMLPLAVILEGNTQAKSWANASDIKPILEQWSKAEPLIQKAVIDGKSLFINKGLPASEVTYLPPLALPNKIVCIGVNYRDHIEEMKIPADQTYPYSFIKPASNTLRGSGSEVAIPNNVSMIDWEAELAVLIGKPARNVCASDALDYIAGYANFNDLSARDRYASRGSVGVDWVAMKGIDGFAPMGPYFVPSCFIDDPQKLSVRLTINGELKQNSSTDQMVFGVAEIIEHLSSVMTLEVGDVIATGTPAGTALGHLPVKWLVPGDIVSVEIEKLGALITYMT
ncbi:fumarylacetoacetate hydrolase family protein [Alteromonas naphthalenivorans]|uniref:2-hydroxyhepta-2,4-diene-1,7-dioate isomerase n=1 Tax=Alteromonas naphthalenivorans TaxID=715451 RepID=F5Z5T2_ALTNA|nr:fumarylacetoacetate hydrolase family protein [Alteromonas naphthalenivorans]AEF05087.1 2-hydroxyhepta-2,4-diene-1,7-dioate isomerase [Alteromonas naphthalenivorans]